MKLTSMDISNKEFKKGFMGYDCEEVDEFLDKITEDYESIYKENSSLKEKMTVLNEKIEHYDKMETTIQNTLVLAQNAAEQAKRNAQKESELIIKNANNNALKIINKANFDVVKVNDDYDKVKQEFIKFKAKFKNFMNTQIDTFENLEKDLSSSYDLSAKVEEDVKEKEIIPAIKEVEEKTEQIPEEIQDVEDIEDIEDIEEEEEIKDTSLEKIKTFFAKNK